MKSQVRARLAQLGHTLPQRAPTREFAPVARLGNVAYVSGHAPFDEGAFQFRGKLGRDFDLEAGRRAAQLAALGCLASLEAEIGDLDQVRQLVKLNGYVNCDPEFKELPQVTDAASTLLVAIFGDRAGRHARTTVGVASLPSGVAVELEMVVLVETTDSKRAS